MSLLVCNVPALLPPTPQAPTTWRCMIRSRCAPSYWRDQREGFLLFGPRTAVRLLTLWSHLSGMQVETVDGAAVITIERAANSTALSQQPDGVVWNVSKDFKSGFVSSWNKFWCA